MKKRKLPKMKKDTAVWNTKKRGELTFIIYKDKDEFVGVCLNFDLVEYGKNPDELIKSIEEGAMSYLEAIRENNLPDDYLNLGTDKKYLDKLKEIDWMEQIETVSKKNKSEEPKLITFNKQTYQKQHGFAM